jgi:hypothetical protein
MPTNKFQSGNTAASKPPELLQTAKIVLAVTPAEKAKWIQAAYPDTLSAYIRAALDAFIAINLKSAPPQPHA